MEQHAEKPGASQSADEGLATSAAEFAGFCRFDDEEGDGETGFHPIVYQNGDWQAERLLNQETPLEYLLTQYQETRTQKQDTQALEKEINERLDGLLSRWLLLKNTGQDMATDNRTEPVHPTH